MHALMKWNTKACLPASLLVITCTVNYGCLSLCALLLILASLPLVSNVSHMHGTHITYCKLIAMFDNEQVL